MFRGHDMETIQMSTLQSPKNCDRIVEYEDEFTDGDCGNTATFPVIINPRRKRFKNKRSNQHHQGRIISKSGADNIIRNNIPNRFRQFAKDLANSLIHSRWKWIICTIVLCYSISWLIFAFLWYLVSREDVHSLTDIKNNTCVVTTGTLAGYILLSIETQTTIGFGTQYPTEFCIESWLVLGLQVLVGVGIEGALVSIVYSKMASPGGQNPLGMFSKKAVVYIMDGTLSLVFRIYDQQGRHSVFTSVKAYLVNHNYTTDGEPSTYDIKKLQLENYGFLLWPVEVIHRITPSSPLWDVSAKDLINKRFEIIIQLKGDSITTGESSQTRTSYLSSEILWGHRFASCVHFNPETEQYEINNEQFNRAEQVDTPLCSAKRLHQVRDDLHIHHQRTGKRPENSGLSGRLVDDWDEYVDDCAQVLVSKSLLRKLFNGSLRYIDD